MLESQTEPFIFRLNGYINGIKFMDQNNLILTEQFFRVTTLTEVLNSQSYKELKKKNTNMKSINTTLQQKDEKSLKKMCHLDLIGNLITWPNY